jgi:hypothetical protein
MTNRDASKNANVRFLFNMIISSSANSVNIVTAAVISGGSANLESRDSLVPLLCVPGFPQVCSEQRKNYRLKNQEYYKDRLKN